MVSSLRKNHLQEDNHSTKEMTSLMMIHLADLKFQTEETQEKSNLEIQDRIQGMIRDRFQGMIRDKFPKTTQDKTQIKIQGMPEDKNQHMTQGKNLCTKASQLSKNFQITKRKTQSVFLRSSSTGSTWKK